LQFFRQVAGLCQRANHEPNKTQCDFLDVHDLWILR
jgi:hypothetical protein